MKKLLQYSFIVFFAFLITASIVSCDSDKNSELEGLTSEERADKLYSLGEERYDTSLSLTEESQMQLFFESGSVDLQVYQNAKTYQSFKEGEKTFDIISEAQTLLKVDGEDVSNSLLKTGYLNGYSFYHYEEDDQKLLLKSEEAVQTYIDYLDFESSFGADIPLLINSCGKKDGITTDTGYELNYSSPTNDGKEQIIKMLSGIIEYINDKWEISDVKINIKLDGDFYISSYGIEVIYSSEEKLMGEKIPIININAKIYGYNETNLPKIDFSEYQDISSLTTLMKVPNCIKEVFSAEKMGANVSFKQTEIAGSKRTEYSEKNTIKFMNGERFSFHIKSVVGDDVYEIESANGFRTTTIFNKYGYAEETLNSYTSTEEEDKTLIYSLIDPVSFSLGMIASAENTGDGNFLLTLKEIPTSIKDSLESLDASIMNPSATVTVIFKDGIFQGYSINVHLVIYYKPEYIADFSSVTVVRYDYLS